MSQDDAIKQLNKKYGDGAVMTLGENPKPFPCLSTGCTIVDEKLGGGLGEGRIVEIFGKESGGKTTLCLSAIAEAQKQGHTCAIVDAEHALDPRWAEKIGCDLEKLLVSQPSCGEEALDIAISLAQAGVKLIVVDSVSALVPRKELEGEMGDANVGLQARLMSQAMRKLTGAISSSKSTVIFINQIRMQIGVMFGNPETTSGGKALRFFASQRMQVYPSQVKDGDEVIATKVKVKVVKNKLAPPFQMGEFYISFKEGIDNTIPVFDRAVADKVITRKGSWYHYNGEAIGQGAKAAIEHLNENDLWQQVAAGI